MYRRPLATLAITLLVLVGLAGTASAASIEQLRTRLNSAREQLAEFSVHEYSDAAALEIERARIDIDEAGERITNRAEEIAEISVIRLENRLKLIEGLLAQATIDSLAEERETSLIEMTREADQAQIDYEATEARRSALRDESEEILRQLEIEE